MFHWLFSTKDWPPRWRCGHWTEGLGYTHIVSELLIWGAYIAIPLILIYFIRKRKDFPMHKVFFLFAAFIIACGFSHLVEAIIFYYPVYRFLGLILVITAIVSWATVFALFRVVPKLLNLPQLEDINYMLEQNVKKEQEKLEVAVELMGVGVFDWDLSKDTVRCSTSLLKMLNLDPSKSEFSSSSFFDYIYYEDKEGLERMIKDNLKNENSQNQRLRMIDKENQTFNAGMIWRSILNQNKGPYRIIGTISKTQ